MWIDDRLDVAESPIHGRGLFFREDLGVDTIVVRLGGQLVTSSELHSLILAANSDPDIAYVDSITVDEDAHLVLPSGTV